MGGHGLGGKGQMGWVGEDKGLWLRKGEKGRKEKKRKAKKRRMVGCQS